MKRGKKHPTQKQVDELIHKDPSRALDQALSALRFGGEIMMGLAKLSQKQSEESTSWTERLSTNAIFLLCGHVQLFNQLLVELASEQGGVAAQSLWDRAKELIAAIHHLALSKPAILKPAARISLFLPSFRADVPRFTDNFEVVREALELSRNCGVNTGSDARFDLDSPFTRLVAEKLAAAVAAREQLKSALAFIRRLRLSRPAWFSASEEDFRLLRLPDFNKETATLWWEHCIKPFLDSPEVQKRIREPVFYKTLSSSAKSEKDYDIKDALRKLCQPRVERLAPKVPHPPAR